MCFGSLLPRGSLAANGCKTHEERRCLWEVGSLQIGSNGSIFGNPCLCDLRSPEAQSCTGPGKCSGQVLGELQGAFREGELNTISAK